MQDPGLEAHSVKFNYLISYLARGSKVTIDNKCLWLVRRLKGASNCIISSYCLSKQKLAAVTDNAKVAESCFHLYKEVKYCLQMLHLFCLSF